MKSDQWKKDRNRLRALTKEVVGKGTVATMVYALISHMRGKLHMRSYAKYHGGWRANTEKFKGEIPPEMRKAYGEESVARYYCARVIIENLNDQAAWIKKYSESASVQARMGEELVELAGRVLEGYPEETTQAATG